MKTKNLKEMTWYKPTYDSMIQAQLYLMKKDNGESIWLQYSINFKPMLELKTYKMRPDTWTVEETNRPKIRLSSMKAIMRKLFQ